MRRIGKVKWFGGNNNTTGRENDYGFIEDLDGSDIYVHKTQVEKPDKLAEGVCVTYILVENPKSKGKIKAENVLLLSEETDIDIIIQCFRDKHLWRHVTKKLSLLPDEQVFELIAEKLSSIGEVEKYQLMDRVKADWQEINIEYGDRLYLLASDEIKKPILQIHFGDFIKIIDGLNKHPKYKIVWDSNLIYGDNISKDDIALSESWISSKKEGDYEKAKMLSARCAELLAMKFYRELGYGEVKDIAITQLHKNSEDWKQYDILLVDKEIPIDLLVDKEIPIDVKNSRRLIHSKRYIEHSVPKFKSDRSNNEVRIAGVISPYLTLDKMQNNKVGTNTSPIRFIGETSLGEIKKLRQYFRSSKIEIEIVVRGRYGNITIPSWLFDYPVVFYGHQQELHKSLRDFEKLKTLPKIEELNILGVNPIAYFLAVGSSLPDIWKELLSEWQYNFYNDLHLTRKEGRISLPKLFLALLTHFVKMIDKNNYDPKGYKDLILFNGDKNYPLGIYDSLEIINKFCSTLDILWKNNKKIHLDQFSYFKFSGLGILQGKRKGNKKTETILAYCGGWIKEEDEKDKKGLRGTCGYSPLVMGEHENCKVCGRLICPKCGFCSQLNKEPCSEIKLRKEKEKLDKVSLTSSKREDSFTLSSYAEEELSVEEGVPEEDLPF